MLKNSVDTIDLFAEKNRINPLLMELLKDYPGAVMAEDPISCFEYPVLQYPAKIVSLGFDKKPLIEGTLLGIKGQYLLLDTGVINIRNHSGYKIILEA